MKDKKITKLLVRWDNHGEAISLDSLYNHLQEIHTKLAALEVTYYNVRFRIEYDRDDDYTPRETFTVSGWYDTDMTEEELEEEREFLMVRKAEQEARDKLQFEKLKKHYGWN